MSAKVNVITRHRGIYQLKRKDAARKVRRESLSFRWRDNFTIVEIEPRPPRELAVLFCDGLIGTGNALPFARVQNSNCKPETINYPIPAAVDHRRAWRNSFMTSLDCPPELILTQMSWFGEMLQFSGGPFSSGPYQVPIESCE